MYLKTFFASFLLLGAVACDGGEDKDTEVSDTEDTEVSDDTEDTEVSDTEETGDTEVDDYVFDETDASAWARVDRIGMPAINTAVITSKDDYNQADPADDAAGDFVSEIIDNLTAIHDALDDDLEGLGLTVCGVDDCVAQAAPLVVPDTIKIDLEVGAGFPNGRLLTDPVMDVTLAVVLLDLSVHEATALVGVNPTENDLSFSDEFPYLAEAH